MTQLAGEKSENQPVLSYPIWSIYAEVRMNRARQFWIWITHLPARVWLCFHSEKCFKNNESECEYYIAACVAVGQCVNESESSSIDYKVDLDRE